MMNTMHEVAHTGGLLLAGLILLSMPVSSTLADGGERDRLLEIARGADALALMASCEESAYVLMIAELVLESDINIQGPDGKSLSKREARKLAEEHQLKSEVCKEVMAERGHRVLAGEYAFTVSGDCEGAMAMWAGFADPKICKDPRIEQDGHEITVLHPCSLEGSEFDADYSGQTFDDAVIVKEELLDYRYMGRIEDRVIRLVVDADRALATWPDWEKKPSRSVLESCRLVLTPKDMRE